MKHFILFSLFILSSIFNLITAQIPTIYASDGESKVNCDEIMNEDGPPFWEVCIEAPSDARTSSTLNPQGKYNYNADNLHDYDPRTPWVEEKDDYGRGEYIAFDLTYGG